MEELKIDQLTLAKSELLKTKEELYRANLLLDKILYSISHTIRQPLTSVLGLTNLVKFDGMNSFESPSDFFNLIDESALKLDASLHELQLYCHMARKDAVIEKIDLRKLICEQYRMLGMEHDCKSVSLSIDLVETESFYGDISMLSFVLGNVLSNAIKFQDEQKGHKYVHIVACVDIDHCFFEIEDNGVGISERDLHHIGEIFFTADVIRAGTGLGLALVKEFVLKSGGELAINSSINKGTSVKVWLPNRYTQFNTQQSVCTNA
jgi:signal transduction histidine kinase